MKTAVIQIKSGIDKNKNIAKAIDFINQAIKKKARFIALPEVFHFRGDIAPSLKRKIAEKTPGESLRPLMDIAKKNGVWILSGSSWEKSTQPKRPYNISALIDPRGNIKAKYRKINLFEAHVEGKHLKEAAYSSSGTRGVVTKMDKFTLGMSVCYDLRFPDMYQKYRLQGANVLTVPSAFTHETGKDHWKILLQARAIENFSYVVAPNQVGKDNKGIRCYGHSMIVDPWGKVLAEASGTKEEIIYANLDIDILKTYRNKFPKFFK